MLIRKRDKATRHAVFYDGERVGDRGADGRVMDRTCPDWFPAIAQEWNGVDTVSVSAGVLLVKPNGHLIWHCPTGVLRIEPGWWIVREPQNFWSMSQATFDDEYELCPDLPEAIEQKEETI